MIQSTTNMNSYRPPMLRQGDEGRLMPRSARASDPQVPAPPQHSQDGFCRVVGGPTPARQTTLVDATQPSGFVDAVLRRGPVRGPVQTPRQPRHAPPPAFEHLRGLCNDTNTLTSRLGAFMQATEMLHPSERSRIRGEFTRISRCFVEDAFDRGHRSVEKVGRGLTHDDTLGAQEHMLLCLREQVRVMPTPKPRMSYDATVKCLDWCLRRTRETIVT